MTRYVVALATLIALIAGTAAASAQSGPGGPITNITPQPMVPPPIGTPSVAPPQGAPPAPGRSEPALVDVPASPYPYNFLYKDLVYGYGFKAGERVDITVSGTPSAQAVAVASGTGSFSTHVQYTWIFCGPRSTRQPPPHIVATGSEGTVAENVRPAPFCPNLTINPAFRPGPLPESPPLGGPPPAVGSGTAVVSGTVVSGITGPGVGPTSEPVHSGSGPIRATQLTKLRLEGFGFVPGEHVTIWETASGNPAPPSVHTEADALGRFSVSVQAYVPFPCQPAASRPFVVAAGDRGTAAVTFIFWQSPIMIACPNVRPPGTTGPSTPQPDNPQIPAPSRQTAVAAPSLTLQLTHAAVRRGHVQRVRLESSTGGTATLVVRYAGGRRQYVRGRLVAGKQSILSWTIPVTSRRGKASISYRDGATGIVLKQSFTVR